MCFRKKAIQTPAHDKVQWVNFNVLGYCKNAKRLLIKIIIIVVEREIFQNYLKKLLLELRVKITKSF